MKHSFTRSLCSAVLTGAVAVQILMAIPGARASAGQIERRSQAAAGASAIAPAVELRQQYNQVAAAIDTLLRIYGQERMRNVADPSRQLEELPGGTRLVLLFWADDEAELFLNDKPISRTRLTPTKVEVPVLYLESENVLRAHCWDTDGVESGFMAGLYLEDTSSQMLRPIVTTNERMWRQRDGEPAQEFFYAHSQPDIPEARIIWGRGQLFGEVKLSAVFAATSIQAAAGKHPLEPPDANSVRTRPMEFHQALSELAVLQERREELAAALAASSRRETTEVRFSGWPLSALSFSLGEAGPLAERSNMETSVRLLAWAKSLPPTMQALVFRPQRELRGWENKTAAVSFQESPGGGEEEDRRRDYVPPAERGPISVVESSLRHRAVPAGGRGVSASAWSLVVAVAVFVGHLTVTGRSWWRLYRSEVWTAKGER